MVKYGTTGNQKVPIYNWATDLEAGAYGQAINMAKLPFAHHHVALMPDAHLGYGMPIGGVLATEGVIIPNAVGVDIGCGMCFVNTNIPKGVLMPHIKKIMSDIRDNIPVGFHKRKKPVDYYELPDPCEYINLPIVDNQIENATYQLGTLGGGNHFIEIQEDENGMIGLMIHSGSRNLGKRVADHYNKIAKGLNRKYYSEVLDEYDLAFLPINSGPGEDYLDEMNYCVEYALRNRMYMMTEVIGIVNDRTDGQAYWAKRDAVINIAHNYAKIERHYCKDVMVHRKGATSAKEGEVGIIPGSQGSPSYIVEGLGNMESFTSCSHGAGRKMGRKQAQRTLSLADEQKRLDDMGVIHTVRNEKDLDEAPSAYKDIDEVMANQVDLVMIRKKLTPLAVIKG